jgi:hypothetical protein
MNTLALIFVLFSAPSASDIDLENNSRASANFETQAECETAAVLASTNTDRHYWCASQSN